KLILVEANVLSRPVDKALVERYSGLGRTDPLFIRPVRAAVAVYENWMHAPPSRDDGARTTERLLAQPPSSFDNGVYVERALQQLNAEDPTLAAQANVERLRQLVAAIERKGARVLLFDLPLLDEIDGARSVRIMHEMIHAAFPQAARWLPFD